MVGGSYHPHPAGELLSGRKQLAVGHHPIDDAPVRELLGGVKLAAYVARPCSVMSAPEPRSPAAAACSLCRFACRTKRLEHARREQFGLGQSKQTEVVTGEAMPVHGSLVKFAPAQQVIAGGCCGDLAHEQVDRHPMSRLPIATPDLGGAPKVEAALSLRQKTPKRAKREFGILGPPLAQRPLVYRMKPPPHLRLRAFQGRRHRIQDAQPVDLLAGIDSLAGDFVGHQPADRVAGQPERAIFRSFACALDVPSRPRLGGRALVPSHLRGSQRRSLAAVSSHRVRGCRSRLNL